MRANVRMVYPILALQYVERGKEIGTYERTKREISTPTRAD